MKRVKTTRSLSIRKGNPSDGCTHYEMFIHNGDGQRKSVCSAFTYDSEEASAMIGELREEYPRLGNPRLLRCIVVNPEDKGKGYEEMLLKEIVSHCKIGETLFVITSYESEEGEMYGRNGFCALFDGNARPRKLMCYECANDEYRKEKVKKQKERVWKETYDYLWPIFHRKFGQYLGGSYLTKMKDAFLED